MPKDTENKYGNFWLTDAERAKSSVPGIEVEGGTYDSQKLAALVDGNTDTSCEFTAYGTGNEVKITLRFAKPHHVPDSRTLPHRQAEPKR